jgi:hypothetical protein
MKLKLNWGTGIAIVIGLFLIANAIVIYKSLGLNFDLVEKEYYPQGLQYQKQIDRFANANSLSSGISILSENGACRIVYPTEMKNSDVKGTFTFFRPSDEKSDFSDSIRVDTSAIQYVNSEKLMKGKYIAKFFWKMNGKEFAVEKVVRVQ